MAIPIISRDRIVVGWTETIPVVVGGNLSHPTAEKLVGGPVAAVYVELLDAGDAVRAGAPEGWRASWRCLALCSERALGRDARARAFPEIQIPSSRTRETPDRSSR
jgi:hypothetical protein